MTNYESMLTLGCIAVILIIAYEYSKRYFPNLFENFEDYGKPNYFSKFFPRRYDIVPGQTNEDFGLIRDPRYSEAYVDVQKIGSKNDFCRMVTRPGTGALFVACALAGTEGLDPYTFRSRNTKEGFEISRDDYYRDVNDDGRDDYCRILKLGPDTWKSQCALASDEGFTMVNIQDNTPPAEIKDLLWFFEGIMVWYRFFDDMIDYADNTQLSATGKIEMDENAQKNKTEGVGINRLPYSSVDRGIPVADAPVAEQLIRIGDGPNLKFNNKVKLRNLRTISVWVYFDAFTNNARIFDFGNGAGDNNVFLGIDGKGDSEFRQQEFNSARPTDTDRVCNARTAIEVSPAEYLKTSDANVDEWNCDGPGQVNPPLETKVFHLDVLKPTATLLFEIWDSRQRKMRIKLPRAIKLQTWQHICITTTDAVNTNPDWQVYIDGKLEHTEENGHLPQSSYTRFNYFGKSNWEDNQSEFANKDERFRGALFDFRLYKEPMSKAKLTRTVEWGKKRLHT